MPTLSSAANAFIDSVLRLNLRLAAFDCDGTLWSVDAGEGFFSWELNRGMVSEETVRWARARYNEYLTGKVSEDDMCAEMTTINAGLAEADIRRASGQFFEEKIASYIFPEMKVLINRLREQGCDIWAVSSTSEWVIREGMKHFGILPNRILACEVEIEHGRITDRLLRVPSGEGKPRAIEEVVKLIPDAAFGNSRWDADMLAQAKRPFPVNPTADLQKLAQERGWMIYFPDAVRRG